jgi:DNA modification methylase
MSESFKLYNGNCLDVLRKCPNNYFDSLVTDPPAGISFMGKEWDGDKGGRKQWIAWMTEIMVECERVLKPGAHGLVWALPRTSHWTAMALEDAGFEIRDVVTHLFGCYSEDTDCFTRTGWVKYQELTKDTDVLQWDNQTSKFSWTKPLAIIVKPYSGKMHNLKNRHTDQLLTPDHRTYCKIKNIKNLHSDLFTVLPPVEFKKSYQIELPLAGSFHGDIEVAPKYAYMVGWWLTDAWTHGDKKACMFSQSKPATLKKLKREYPDRKLSWDMLNWSDAAKSALIEGLVDGDGSVREGQHGYVFWSKDPERLEIFQMLALSSGHRTLVDFEKGCVHVNPKFASTELQAKHYLEPQEYTGNIWCLTVPCEAFLVRRNGKPFISGNTGFPKSLDVSKAIDKAAGAEREVAGEKTFADGSKARRTQNLGGNSFQDPESRTSNLVITAPATDAAKQWAGWGTALKPASEYWILIRKPISEKTVAANVLKHGVGGLNIDATRINTSDHNLSRNILTHEAISDIDTANIKIPQGRFPANLILSHNFDCELVGTKKVKGLNFNPENSVLGKDHRAAVGYANDNGTETVPAWQCTHGCAVKMLDEQSGLCKTGNIKAGTLQGFGGGRNTFGEGVVPREYKTDEATGASRFFYVAKASKSDKSEGVKDLLTWESQDRNLQDLMAQLNELLRVIFVDTMQPQSDTEWNTLWFGKPQMDPSLTDVKSIIETTLKTITDLKTWNASQPLSIKESIQAAIRMIEKSGLNLAEVAESTKKFLETTTSEKTDIATNASLALLNGLSEIRKLAKQGNIHATVKSTTLMTYLIKLVTPEGGMVLDPFMGSGSTGVAAIKNGFVFRGIELNAEYFKISEARLEDAHKEAMEER